MCAQRALRLQRPFVTASFDLSCVWVSQWRTRVVQLVRRRGNRIFVSQMIEDCFNKGKASVSDGSNERCTPQRFLAHCLDKGVAAKTHHYEEVDRSHENLDRDFHLDANAFHAPLRPDCLSAELSALKLNSIVGYGDAAWYSPQAKAVMAPHADTAARRQLGDAGRLRDLEHTWLSRLCASRRIMIRLSGSADCFFSMGDVCGVLVTVWPAKRVPEAQELFVPVCDGRTCEIVLAVTRLADFEAVPIDMVSPMHRAIQLEKPGVEPKEEVRLKEGSHYGELPSAAQAGEVPLSLL